MTNRLAIWGVHDWTMQLMAKGMTKQELMNACTCGRPLTLINDDSSEVTGQKLYDIYQHLCKDHKEKPCNG